MNEHKKVFWWSLLFFVVSLIGIIIFSLLSSTYTYIYIYNIFLNVFISLIGGALISLVTSLVAFYQIKKQYEIQFISEIKYIRKLLKNLVNWYDWKFKSIDYELETSQSLQNPKNEEILNNVRNTNDTLVQEFVDTINLYCDYDYNKVYYIMDDYCSFNLFNRNNKIRHIMYEIMFEINKYNILYDKNMNLTLQLYNQNIYNSYVLYENIIQVFNKKYIDKSKIITDLSSLIKCYFCLTKVDRYTEKLAIKNKKENQND